MRSPGLARLLFLLGALLLAAPPAVAAEGVLPPEEAATIIVNLGDLLANEPALPLPVRQRSDALDAYYHQQGGALIWLGTPRMAELVAHLQAAEEDGLDPASYPSAQLAKLAAAVDQMDARNQAIVELAFSAAFLEFAADLQVGRFLPRKIDPNFFLVDKSIDQVAALTGVARAPDVAEFFAEWQPKSADYAALKAALAQYRAIASAGGWPAVPLGDVVKPGTDDPRVPAIRARLAVTDGPMAPDSGEQL